MAQRTPAEIRSSIESTRQELAFSVNDLRAKVNTLTDWRRPLAENRQAAIVGAAVAGFSDLAAGQHAPGTLRARPDRPGASAGA